MKSTPRLDAALRELMVACVEADMPHAVLVTTTTTEGLPMVMAFHAKNPPEVDLEPTLNESRFDGEGITTMVMAKKAGPPWAITVRASSPDRDMAAALDDALMVTIEAQT